nr:MAG TPA: hypothetical protein [Microviridae sp.]
MRGFNVFCLLQKKNGDAVAKRRRIRQRARSRGGRAPAPEAVDRFAHITRDLSRRAKVHNVHMTASSASV